MTMTSDLRVQALHVAAVIDPERLTGAQAAAMVDDLAVADKALAGMLMFVALRVAHTHAWQGQGHQTAADWLAAKTGISVYEAGRQLGTAKKAERLPKTKKAMKKGDLSPNQADAVTDGATADPAAEDDLLAAAANDTNKHLREEAARRKAAATDSATREKRNHTERSVRRYTDAEGAFNLRWRGPAADGVKLEAMLRPLEEEAFRVGRRTGVRDTFENRSYDAAMALFGIRPLHPTGAAAPEPAPTPRPGAAPAPAPAPEPAPTPQPDAAPAADSARHGAGAAVLAPARSARAPGGNTVKVIVRIDHTALLRGHTIAGETCDVAGLGPISVAAAKDLMADAFLAAVITKGRDVVNVAHLGRGLNAHQRTAVEALGLRCSNIACNRTIALQIDHRTPYAANPVTELDNQDPLCPECHRRKTHHGHHLEPGTGPRRFLAPVAADLCPDQEAASGRTQRVQQPSLC